MQPLTKVKHQPCDLSVSLPVHQQFQSGKKKYKQKENHDIADIRQVYKQGACIRMTALAVIQIQAIW
ncbi:hypothetical protein [Vibrio quintilis]|uniref:hypothetical protein n=1 Tax=Vibrio quintilis TaxID=1117707 RepID=UPI0009371438|nr:hypothetical protein [Vibrio quintilis]